MREELDKLFVVPMMQSCIPFYVTSVVHHAMVEVSISQVARVAKLADARDLKSRVPKGTYRFDSGPGHQLFPQVS